jgi:site-specific DNA-methyltransferase (cytosine-N4-specific)
MITTLSVGRPCTATSTGAPWDSAGQDQRSWRPRPSRSAAVFAGGGRCWIRTNEAYATVLQRPEHNLLTWAATIANHPIPAYSPAVTLTLRRCTISPANCRTTKTSCPPLGRRLSRTRLRTRCHRWPSSPSSRSTEPALSVDLSAAALVYCGRSRQNDFVQDGTPSGGTDDERINVRCGDAWDLLAEISPASVDLVVTSPPYWGLRHYGLEHNGEVLVEWLAEGGDVADAPPYEWYRNHGGQLGLEPTPHWYVSHLSEFMRRLRPALKPTGSLWLNLGDTYFGRWASIRPSGRQGLGSNARTRRRVPSGGYRQDKQLLLVPARVAIAMQDEGWILRNDLIWSKPETMPRPERDRLRLSHEHLFHFVSKPTRGRAAYYYDLTGAEAGARDVVSVQPVPGSDGHSATFPSALIAPRIQSSCPPGGLVLDPFAGTGRSLVEAVQSGRRALGFEISPIFAQAARVNAEAALIDSACPRAASR